MNGCARSSRPSTKCIRMTISHVSSSPSSHNMRVLQIGSDRSKRGILYSGSAAFKRQQAYAKEFGALDIIGFSLRADGAKEIGAGALHVYPTNSRSRFFYGFGAFRIARTLPRPDVVSVQDPFEVGFIGWIIARRFGMPLYVQVHTDFLAPEYANLSPLNRLRVRIAGFVLRRAARIRAVSERIKRCLETHSSFRAIVSVLPIFVDAEHFRWALPDPALIERFARFTSKVLVVSRLESEKDIELA